MSDLNAVVQYVRSLERRLSALERNEAAPGGGGGAWPGFSDAEGDPAAVATAADGLSTYPARRDHAHALGTGSVDSAALASGAVTTAKIAAGAVGTSELASNAVTNAELADMAQATVKGRAAGAGTGDPVDLSAAQLIGILATGSGLDADLLDGQHAAAFAAYSHNHDHGLLTGLGDDDHTHYYNQTRGDARYSQTTHAHDADYVNVAGDTMTGALAINSTLAVSGTQTMTGTNPGIDIGSAAMSTGDARLGIGSNRTGDGHCYITFDADSDAAYETRIIRWSGADGAFDIMNRGTGLFSLNAEGGAAFRVSTANTERLRVTAGGDIGFGTSAPAGRLHVHDGTGGWLHVTKTDITGTAQVLVANAVGDVANYARVDTILSDGTARSYQSFSLEQGGAMTQTFTLGSTNYQFRLNADGSLDVRRTAGAANGTAICRIMWY